MSSENGDVTVTITRSAGNDGAVVVMIDTTFEPDGTDGSPGLRVVVNDVDVLNAGGRNGGDNAATGGVDYRVADVPRQASSRTLLVALDDIAYREETTS